MACRVRCWCELRSTRGPHAEKSDDRPLDGVRFLQACTEASPRLSRRFTTDQQIRPVGSVRCLTTQGDWDIRPMTGPSVTSIMFTHEQ